jgi:hypothetical protein
MNKEGARRATLLVLQPLLSRLKKLSLQNRSRLELGLAQSDRDAIRSHEDKGAANMERSMNDLQQGLVRGGASLQLHDGGNQAAARGWTAKLSLICAYMPPTAQISGIGASCCTAALLLGGRMTRLPPEDP